MAPDQTQKIQELEREAKRVLDKLRAAGQPERPLVVEFSGTPKAGKSTIINSLRLFLARNKFHVFVLTERASTCPIRDKKHPFFNIWTACATLTQLIEAVQARKDDIVIMDRGLFDALAWMRWLEDRHKLDSAQRDTIERFLTLDLWSKLTDLVLIMRVSPEEALEREFKEQVTRKPGSIMNPETIQEFNVALDNVAQQPTPFTAVRTVDTTVRGPIDTSYEVVKMTLEALDNASS